MSRREFGLIVTPIRPALNSEQLAMFDKAINEVAAINNASQQQAIDFALNHQLTLIMSPPDVTDTTISPD
jgi:hypothetical protein